MYIQTDDSHIEKDIFKKIKNQTILLIFVFVALLILAVFLFFRLDNKINTFEVRVSSQTEAINKQQNEINGLKDSLSQAVAMFDDNKKTPLVVFSGTKLLPLTFTYPSKFTQEMDDTGGVVSFWENALESEKEVFDLNYKLPEAIDEMIKAYKEIGKVAVNDCAGEECDQFVAYLYVNNNSEEYAQITPAYDSIVYLINKKAGIVFSFNNEKAVTPLMTEIINSVKFNKK